MNDFNGFMAFACVVAVVFAALLIYALRALGRLNRLVGGQPERREADSAADKSPQPVKAVTPVSAAHGDDVVAAISAVLSVVTGGQPLKIKSIRRSAPRGAGKTPAWAQAGRQEQIYSRIN